MAAKKRLVTDDLWRPDQPLPGKRVLLVLVERCAEVWGLPRVGRIVTVGYNPRLRTTLGRAVLGEQRVELNVRLLREHPEELIPTLVHELAHLAVHVEYGDVAPHGRHFAALMRAAGFSPKATHNVPVAHLRRRRGRYLYLHGCSNCGASFIARSVRRDCYCRACGPDMTWDVYRAPNTREGRDMLGRLERQWACGV